MMGANPSACPTYAMAANLGKLFLALVLLAAMPAAWTHERTVTLSLGTPSRLALDRAYATVIVGDPKIVDVETGDRESVLIEPLRPGKTNLVFIDAQGLVIANVRVTVCGASDACTATAGEI
jgi:Flp pilus assembly secretin CpaC